MKRDNYATKSSRVYHYITRSSPRNLFLAMSLFCVTFASIHQSAQCFHSENNWVIPTEGWILPCVSLLFPTFLYFSLLSSSTCLSILPSFPFNLYFSLCSFFSLVLSPSPSVCWPIQSEQSPLPMCSHLHNGLLKTKGDGVRLSQTKIWIDEPK